MKSLKIQLKLDEKRENIMKTITKMVNINSSLPLITLK